MTKVYIHSDNKRKIEQLIKLGKEEFDLKLTIAENSIISSDLDYLFRNSKSTNIGKAEKINRAIEGLGKLLDGSKKRESSKIIFD
jgi:hypothetical protein